MSTIRQGSLFFLYKKNDKVSKLTLSISAVASFVLVIIILYIGCHYHTNKNGFLKENGPESAAHHIENLPDGRCEEICTTKDCLYAASNIVEKLDTNVDPCDDFYHFACGNWVKKFGKKDNASVMDELEEILKLRIKEVLEKIQPAPGTAVHKLKTVYNSCVSKSASELNAVPSALEFLEKIGIPNWPRLDENFRFVDPSLEEVLAVLTVYDIKAFFKPGPDLPQEETLWNVNISDTTQRINLTVWFQFDFEHSEHMKFLKEVASQIYTYFGFDDGEVSRIVAEIAKLNTEIGKNKQTKLDEREKKCFKNIFLCLDHPLNCSADVDAPMRFVCRVIEHFLRMTDLSEVYSIENINLENYAGFEALYDVLRNTSHRTIAHHLALSFMWDNLPNLNFYFQRLLRNHPRMFGFTRTYPIRDIRWQHCVQWVSKNMPSALTMAYVPGKLPVNDRDEIKSIFDAIKNETLDAYRENPWFENHDLQQLITEKMGKVLYFTEKYINYMLDEDHLNTYYEDFDPTSHSYLTNMIEFKRHSYMYLLKRLQYKEKLMFEYDPFLVNAYHMESRLDLLFGILIPPLYIHGRPRSLNFGSLGTFIAHEFGHEMNGIFNHFMDAQKDLQEFENQNSQDFMSRYKSREMCLIEQYDKYKVEQIGQYLNGTFTFFENFADSFSVTWAENARLRYLSNSQTPESKLPIQYTSEEAFYIVYAQHWCHVRSDESALEHMVFDMHSPPESRVLGTLSNSRRFAETFHCPTGSRMNPALKCNFLV